jgi:hypothetical protein
MPDLADLALRRDDAAHRYEAALRGHHAVATYERDGGTITLTHTVVPPALEGQGVGSALVRYALDDVRAHGWQVVPLCPFVRAYLARHPADQELVRADARHLLARPGAGGAAAPRGGA